MIQRDYILRMIEEFLHMLDRLESLVEGRSWDEAKDTLDEAFKKLAGGGPQEVSRLSNTALLARLVANGPTQAVKDKTMILARLLKEAGDMAVVQEQWEDGQACYLKALHILLETFGRDEPYEVPEFVPTIEHFMELLKAMPKPLSLETRAMVMQHYEVSGQFAKAVEQLQAMRHSDPDQATLKDFGRTFFQRLLRLSDDELEAGNLAREDLETAWQAWGS